MIVVAVIVVRIGFVVRSMDDAGILVDRRGTMTMHLAMMLDGIAARIARMRAENSDQPGDYSADQRQKHDCLDHRRASLRMISGHTKPFVRETRYPPIGSQPKGMLFRIMR
jgi:hypothetical protein